MKAERSGKEENKVFTPRRCRGASCFIQNRERHIPFLSPQPWNGGNMASLTGIKKGGGRNKKGRSYRRDNALLCLVLQEDVRENKIHSKNKKRQACKPGSVPSGSPVGSHHLSGIAVARNLYLPTPRKTEHGQHSAPKGFSVYAAFHPVRFARLAVSPRRRWALTPPFHPYRPASGAAVVFCCTVCGAGDTSHAPSR